MNKKRNLLNKFGAVALSAGILTGGFLPVVGHAAEPEVTAESRIIEKDIVLSDKSTVIFSDNVSRATVTIKGNLTGSKPPLLKPRATAKTSTSQNVYSIRAKVDSNNNGTSTSSSGWKTLNNTSIANSGQLIANTTKAKFTGYHQMKITSSSSWFSTANTGLTY